MIRLYLVRHAADEDRRGARRVKRRARRRFRRMADAFAQLEEPIELICAGSKSHVQETAAMLARSLGQRDVAVLEELSSHARAAALLRVLAAHIGGSEGVVLVGNGRQLHELLRVLGIEKNEIRLRKGSIVRIDVDALPRPRLCIPRFRVRPSAADPADAFVGMRRAS